MTDPEIADRLYRTTDFGICRSGYSQERPDAIYQRWWSNGLNMAKQLAEAGVLGVV